MKNFNETLKVLSVGLTLAQNAVKELEDVIGVSNSNPVKEKVIKPKRKTRHYFKGGNLLDIEQSREAIARLKELREKQTVKSLSREIGCSGATIDALVQDKRFRLRSHTAEAIFRV